MVAGILEKSKRLRWILCIVILRNSCFQAARGCGTARNEGANSGAKVLLCLPKPSGYIGRLQERNRIRPDPEARKKELELQRGGRGTLFGGRRFQHRRCHRPRERRPRIIRALELALYRLGLSRRADRRTGIMP